MQSPEERHGDHEIASPRIGAQGAAASAAEEYTYSGPVSRERSPELSPSHALGTPSDRGLAGATAMAG